MLNWSTEIQISGDPKSIAQMLRRGDRGIRVGGLGFF
jgi:hypothetical protein